MKKYYSLIKACMTNDMNLFKITTKNNKKIYNILVPLFIAFYLMFMIWNISNYMFKKLEPLNIQYIVLPLFTFFISIMTIIEGIYKSGPLMFNCKDDQLLLSLPIKKQTILFIRILKFYLFELMFNSMFLLPTIIAYIKWIDKLTWTYFITSIIMIFLLPIIPIIISCIIGVIISSITSRFKYKNIMQTIISMIFLIGILLISYNSENIFSYLIKHAKNINDIISKIYYPAGIYAKLLVEFNFIDIIKFIIINFGLFTITTIFLSTFYFKINSRLKKIINTKNRKNNKMKIRSYNKTQSLVKKELNTFFQTPVFIINAGFAIVLFIIATITIITKYDSVYKILTNPNGLNISKNIIQNNTSIVLFILIIATSFMTSITNSVISIEGKNINTLKTLPIKTKTILLSKIYSASIITTPILIIGNILLFIKFKINIIESLLLIIICIFAPLISHFIGLIINLKFPKLDAENATEIVKQSTSSLISVMIGMVLLMSIIITATKAIVKINSLLLLTIFALVFIIIDLILYLYLTKISIKDFENLSI